MSSARFDAFTRRAGASVSRRGSIMTLGGAGLAAALGGPLTAAKKSGNKRKKKANTCKKQVGQCDGFFASVCGSPAGCPEAFACCDLLATCNAGGFIACLGALEF